MRTALPLLPPKRTRTANGSGETRSLAAHEGVVGSEEEGITMMRDRGMTDIELGKCILLGISLVAAACSFLWLFCFAIGVL